MRRMLGETGWLLLVLLLSSLHIGFLNGIPGVGAIAHPVFLLSIFCALGGHEQRAIAVALIGGSILDWYSVLPFGVYVIASTVAVSAFIFFQRTIFKQRAVHFYLLNTLVASCAFLLTWAMAALLSEKLNWIYSGLIDFHVLWKNAVLFLIVQSAMVFFGALLFIYIRERFFSQRTYAEKSI